MASATLDGAFGAINFASYDVAVHVGIFPGLWFEPGSGRCYEREPLYIAKEKHRRPDICSKTGQPLGKSCMILIPLSI